MTKDVTLENFILQTDLIIHVTKQLGKETWLTCYETRQTETDDRKENAISYCALLPIQSADQSLEAFAWDLDIRAHGPGFSQSYIDGKPATTYHRFTCSEKYLPLVILREFSGAFPEYWDVLEEFRLFHNLHEDKKTGDYSKIVDDNGTIEKVVRVTRDKVEIRLLEIRQFLAAKEMVLGAYFEQTRWIKEELPDGLKKRIAAKVHDGDLSYTRYGENSVFSTFGAKAFSKVLGKKIVRPLSLEKCGIWPFKGQDKQFEEFIVGVNESGDAVLSTCNKDKLANYFGANPDAEHFLTPIFFNREVLTKYFANTEKYDLQDGWLYCHQLWSLRLDTNHPDHVTVFLGDLCSLPYAEQKHWRSFNFPPEGRKMSRAYFERSFLGNFHDTETPDLSFKQAYERIQEEWRQRFGWDLFLPLDKKDAHYLASLRVPLNGQQSEFDHQIHGLAKVLVDSINTGALVKEYGLAIPDDKKGKSLFAFELFLRFVGIFDTDGYIRFLKDLQGLRSTGTAHRKGGNYDKILKDLDVEKHGYVKLAATMFHTSEALINDLRELTKEERKSA